MTRLNEYVLVAEAASILGVSENTVRAWSRAEKLPVYRNPANNYRMFRRNDLDQFLEKAAQLEPRG